MKNKQRQPYFRYLLAVSVLGFIPIIVFFIQFPQYEPKLNFLLLLVLSIVAQNASTSVPVGKQTGVTYSIGTAVSVAALPSFGPIGAAFIEFITALSLWLAKPADKTTWKRSWSQLGFNSGMASLSLFISGLLFIWLREWLGSDNILGQTIPWLIVAILSEQINLWLLIGILRLQHKQEFNAFTFWKENSWASQVNIMVVTVGGGVLAYALQQYDWIGVLVFFLPIVLSAYAFRLYVNQMKAHMDNLENIVAERTQELATLMKEKDQFLAVLTHDMKSPLTSIGIYAGLIKDRPQLIVDRPDMAGVIMRSQEILTDMVNNILDLEQLQVDGSMPLDKETIDLASMIDVTIQSLSAQASEKEINLQIKVEPSPLITKVDRRQFKRVIQNLVSNAIKYTPKMGNVCLHAFIKPNGTNEGAESDELNSPINIRAGAIIIAVKDDGYGIPEDELPYVFDRYRRVAKHKNVAAGTGLGLAITKAIVEAHDGNILVSSEEGKGSTFTVELPL